MPHPFFEYSSAFSLSISFWRKGCTCIFYRSRFALPNFICHLWTRYLTIVPSLGVEKFLRISPSPYIHQYPIWWDVDGNIRFLTYAVQMSDETFSPHVRQLRPFSRFEGYPSDEVHNLSIREDPPLIWNVARFPIPCVTPILRAGETPPLFPMLIYPHYCLPFHFLFLLLHHLHRALFRHFRKILSWIPNAFLPEFFRSFTVFLPPSIRIAPSSRCSSFPFFFLHRFLQNWLRFPFILSNSS